MDPNSQAPISPAANDPAPENPVIDSAVSPPNPFVGPQPLRTGQPIFARQTEIQQLYYMLLAQRIVLFYSPSGAGKSSLLQAGLIPQLTADFDVWPPVRVNLAPEDESPGAPNRYVRSCNLAWESELPEAGRRPDAVLSAMTLAEYVASRPRRADSGNLVLLFDQFEEILTAGPLELDQKRAFFEQLGALLQQPDIWAVIALREDYLAPLDPYADQVPTHLRNRFRLDLFTREAAAEAIAGISKSAGRAFTPEALRKLVADLAEARIQQPDGSFVNEPGPYVEPLQLQVAGRSLWQRLPAGQTLIEESDVAAFGDVGAALAEYYAAEVARAASGDDRVERAIREWFGSNLIAPGNIRGQVVRGEGKTGGLANDLVEALVHTHLVRGEQRLGATWYELAHDRLIQPVQQNNAAWFQDHLSPLQKAAALWRTDRRDGLLFLGKDLIEAKAWAAKNASALEDFEQEFLEASEALQQENDNKKRNAKLLKLISAVAVAAAVAGIILAFLAWRETQTANQALAESVTASVPATLAVENGQADALADLAYALRKYPGSLDARAWISTLLAGRSWWIPTPKLDYGRPFASDYQQPGYWFTYALSPGGHILALGQWRYIQLWNVDTGNSVKLTYDNSGPVYRLCFAPRQILFSPDEKRLLLRCDGFKSPGEAQEVYDIGTRRLLAEWGLKPSKTTDQFGNTVESQNDRFGPTAFSPDGGSVATATIHTSHTGSDQKETDSSATFIRNAKTGRLIGQPMLQHGDVDFIDWSPDSRRIVTAVHDFGTRVSSDAALKYVYKPVPIPDFAQVWDAATGRPIGPPIKENGVMEGARFSPDGKFLLISAGNHDDIRDAATGRMVGKPFATIDPSYLIADAAFSPNGNLIVTNPAAQIWRWDPKNGAKSQFNPGAGSSGYGNADIQNAFFTADSSALVTFSVVNGIQTRDTATGKPASQDLPLWSLPGSGTNVLRFGFAPAGPAIFTGQETRLLRVWRMDRSVEIGSGLKSAGTPIDMDMVDGQVRILSWNDGRIVVTDRAGRTAGKPIPVDPRIVLGTLPGLMRLSPDGTRLLTPLSGPNGSVSLALWDLSTGLRIGAAAPPGLVYAWFDPYGPFYVLTDGARTAQAFDERTGARLGALRTQGSLIGSGLDAVRFSPNGRDAAVSFWNSKRRKVDSVIWDLRSGKQGAPIFDGAAYFTPNGKSLLDLSNVDAGTFNVPGLAIYLDPLSPSGLTGINRSSEWSLFLLAQLDKLREFLNLPPLEWPAGPMPFPGGLRYFQLSHDGRLLLAVPSTATVVQLRSMSTRLLAGPPIYPGGVVKDIQFSPDDKIILIQTNRGNGQGPNPGVQLWSTSTLRPIGDWIPVPDESPQFAFSADDRNLLVYSPSTHTVQAYPVFLGSATTADDRLLADLAEAASGERYNPATHSPVLLTAEEQYKLIQNLRAQYRARTHQDIPAGQDFLQAFVTLLSQSSSQ